MNATTPDPHALLTTGDAARELNISPDMVRLLCRTGRLPHEVTASGQYLVRRRDALHAAEERRQRRGA